MIERVQPDWRLSQRKDEARSRRSRVAAWVRLEVLESRRLLTEIVTGLTGDSGGSYTQPGIASSLNYLGDTYQFTVGEGASINVSLQTPTGGQYGQYGLYSINVSDEPYGSIGVATVFASGYDSGGTVSLPQVTGTRTHAYYVTVGNLGSLSDPSVTQFPYTLTISTGSGEPQPDLAINSATLNQYNNSVSYSYSASNDPGTYTIGAYLSATPDYEPTYGNGSLASQTITTGATSGSTGTLNFGSVAPSAQYPYLLVNISGGFENNYTNNTYTFTIPPVSPPALDLDSVSLSSDGKTVTVNYSVAGRDLPSAGTIGFYWATGPNLSDKLEKTPLYSIYTLNSRASSAIYTQSDSLISEFRRPANASYLLAVANPPYADPAHNVVSLSLVPNIALVSTPNPSTYGQPITFTATVSSGTSDLTPLAGTVTFMDGSTAIGTDNLNASGVATYTTTSTQALSIGAHSITAVYKGDSFFYNSTSSPVIQSVNGQSFNVDLAATDVSIAGLPPKLYNPVDIHLDEFVANFTEQATSPLDPGAIGTATGNTSTNNGVSTPGRYIEVTIPSFGSAFPSFGSEVIAYATVQVTVTLFQTAPLSVALGAAPPPDNQIGTIVTGAKNVWLNQHKASDEVLEWSTQGFTTYWENTPLGIGPVQIPGSATGPLEDWVDISPEQAALPFTTIIQQAEQTIESANSLIVFRRNLLPAFLPGLMILDPGQTSLLVTDPNGNQTGVTANGTIIQHIPGAVYFPSLPLVFIAAPMQGLYKTEVKGIISGNYQLVTALMNEEKVTDQQSSTGTLVQGQSVTYLTTVDATTDSVNTILNPSISTKSSGLVYNRATQLFGGMITLTNVGTTSLTGSLEVELTGLPDGVTLANSSGIASDGNPYILVNLTNGLLAPGQSINFTVLFSNPQKLSFQYGTSIFDENSNS